VSPLVATLTDADGDTSELTLDGQEVLIGKRTECAIRLQGWRIGGVHAKVVRTARGPILMDAGHFHGTWVNGARVARHGPLSFADQIQIGGYKLRIQESKGSVTGAVANETEPREAAIPLKVPAALPARPNTEAEQATSADLAKVQARHAWRKHIHEQLLDIIDLRRRDLTRMSDAELRTETEVVVREILNGLSNLPADVDRQALSREVLNEAIGLGPLEDLLADETVSEIMVNRFDEIFVERSGRLHRYPLSFTSDRAVQGVIERIVAPLGRRIDESSPLVDARLKDGSRVNAVIPPLALKGPTLTIRKFSSRRLAAHDMVDYGSLSQPMVEFLRLCVAQRKNMVVAGGTGTGKTTFLNVLSNFIPDGERVITIEDAAELRLNHTHLISLESRPSNVEGRGAVTIRDLVRNSLRMRPDRIVVGECRGGEALDMLQAMNTGHEGSLTTIHANSPRDALSRLETLVLMAGMDLPISAVREQIASAIDVVVQQTRFSCGARKVTSITEITGMENGKIQTQEIFRFDRHGCGDDGRVSGSFVGCDTIPSFYDELRSHGVPVDLTLFDRRPA
jgi:pilus assembly protein CpaF